jgi:predicted HTH transcriptional regulator
LSIESKKVYWDEQICERASLRDVDWNKVDWFKSAYKVVSKRGILATNERLLENIRCIREGIPTNAGMTLLIW